MATGQPHQRSEHVIEPASQLGCDIGQVTECRGDFEASEHLA
jgi:hypothetical protein